MRKDFVANVSHELKTPLTSIRGFAETLIEGGIDDKVNALKFLNTIKNNADRLCRLVNDLLTLSNIELGKVSFNIRPVALIDIVQSVSSTLEPKAKERGLQLGLDVADGLLLRADRDRLEQVVMNLVDNAIKFTEKGAVFISASSSGNTAKVAVKDTGIGIPANELPRLGERFYRVDPARSRGLGGTGLGLAIVKHLILSMDGSLSIESEVGRGTTVTFTMPASGVTGQRF